MNKIIDARYGKMIYNTKDIYVGKSFENYGEFSELEVELFRDCLKESNAVLDVGANIGSHTIAFRSIVGDSGMVIAYEPERINFNTLCGNVAINNYRNIYCFQNAVGSKPGTIAVPELNIEKTENYGGISLTKDYSSAHHYTVPLVTVDQFRFGKINFIKIDVEGMETEVIDGAAESIQRCKPFLYVENDRKQNCLELVAKIYGHQYEIYEHNPNMYNPNNFYNNKENLFLSKSSTYHVEIVSVNLFAHHRSVECPVDLKKHGLKKIT